MNIFRSDAAAMLSQPGPSDVCTHYTTCLKTLLDSHAPLITRSVPNRPSAPWMSNDIKTARRTRRRAERMFKKTGLLAHRQVFVNEKNKVNRMLRDAKSHHLRTRIEGSHSSRELFRVAAEMLGSTCSPLLPSSIPRCELPDAFNTFFYRQDHEN